MNTNGSGLRIAQSSKIASPGRWNWEVWIEGPDPALDKVRDVTYTLHRTFANPVRTITDRATKFKLKSSGWGTFTIPVVITFKDGHTEDLKHALQFEGAHPPKSQSRVFLSTSRSEWEFVRDVQAELTKDGYVIVSVPPSTSDLVEFEVERTIRQADIAVIVVNEYETPRVETELRVVNEIGIPWIKTGPASSLQPGSDMDSPADVQAPYTVPITAGAASVASSVREALQRAYLQSAEEK